MTIDIICATLSDQLEEIRRLFREYEEALGVDLCFQGFEKELQGLPGKYAYPKGALFLAVDGGTPAGCVALRELGEGVCEMKRLFVRPQYRGQGVGRMLASAVIKEARELGYSSMRLDTLNNLREAVELYKSLGFRKIEPYYDNPLPGALYWELDLGPQP
ncbi:MAG: GNAT family N-acetyltransferase [Deltaproteobacteria bacterium]|nr:GNAT family N-acetyltransferase [Deltaproteobacteria bacterium]